MFPMGIGFGYFVPLMLGWEWIPSKRGFVSGMILCGFGFGSFIFGFIAKAMINPDNALPEKLDSGDKIYDFEIASRVSYFNILKFSGSSNTQMDLPNVAWTSYLCNYYSEETSRLHKEGRHSS